MSSGFIKPISFLIRGVTSYVDGELDEHLSPSILFVVESSVMSFLMREKSYIDVTVGLTPPSIFGRKRKVEEEKSYIAVKDEKSQAMKEAAIIARLVDLETDQVLDMPLYPYCRLTEAYSAFTT